MSPRAGGGAPTQKFQNRQAAIVEAASAILNRKGLKGMTLAEVGEQVGLVPTGVAYYFASKEVLAAACFQRSLDAYIRLIAEAAQESSVEGRLTQLIRLFLAQRQRVARGQSAELVQFDDVRALADPQILTGYEQMFRALRALFRSLLPPGFSRPALNARTHLLMQQLLWLDGWLYRYEADDYDRIAERMIDVLLHGLGAPAANWAPQRVEVTSAGPAATDEATETFLRAATQLINEQGYFGASVDRISARLDVTKGAFYHYIDGKDDLVTLCFARATQVVRNTQLAADRLPTDNYNRLASTLASLVQVQLEGGEPLLRGAMRSLPEAIRDRVLNDYERIAVRFGSMLSDGQLDGSVRQLDVQIAAHMLNAVVNAVGELMFWLPNPPGDDTVDNFVRPFFESLARTELLVRD